VFFPPPTRALAPVAIAAAVLAAASCSDSTGSPATAASVQTPPPASSAAPGMTASGSATSGPATATGGPAAATGAAPNGSATAEARRAIDGDVDGDGRPDKLTVTGGKLAVRYSAGGTDSAAFEAGDATSVRVLGASDADSDGHAEVFVQVDQAASQQVSTVFRYAGGHLRLVTLDGQQARMAYGGSTGFVASWACRPASAPGAALATAAGPSTGPNVYRLTVTYYRFDGSRLVLQRSRTNAPANLDTLPLEHDSVSGQPGCGPARPGQ